MAQDLVHLHGDVRDVLGDGLDPLHEAGPRGKPRDRSRGGVGGLWEALVHGQGQPPGSAPGTRRPPQDEPKRRAGQRWAWTRRRVHAPPRLGDSRTIHGTRAAAQARHVARSCPRVCAPRASRGNDCGYSKQRGSCQSPEGTWPGTPRRWGPFPGHGPRPRVCFPISSRGGYIVPK